MDGKEVIEDIEQKLGKKKQKKKDINQVGPKRISPPPFFLVKLKERLMFWNYGSDLEISYVQKKGSVSDLSKKEG